MTTTPVRTVYENKGATIQVPNYCYPSHERVKLVAVKQDVLLNPNPPTMRQIDRDNILHKLSDEHCRTSTTCTKDDFNRYGSKTVFGKDVRPTFSCINLPGNSERVRANHFPRQIRTEFSMTDFSNYLDSRNCNPSGLPPLTHIGDRAQSANIQGYAPSLFLPDYRHSWRYTLKSAHEIDSRGRKPFPADMLKQYRNTHSKTGVTMAPGGWRS